MLHISNIFNSIKKLNSCSTLGRLFSLSVFVECVCTHSIREWIACSWWRQYLETQLLLLLLLLLSHLSRVRLCATPETAAHEAPLSLGFSRQEHWSGLPFPSPCMKVKSESEVAQSCLTLSDPMDCSLPSSSIHGIFQARVLEWGAIAFSGSYAYTRQI